MMSLQVLLNILGGFTWRDVLDILLLFLLFYYLLLLVKGTNSYQVAVGLLLTGVLALVANVLELAAFSYILNNFLTYVIFAVIVLFQDELRKIISEIGSTLKKKVQGQTDSGAIDELVNAVLALSLTRTGALIAVEREINMRTYVNRPVEIDSRVNKDLLLTIFFPNSPLHDGAVVISRDRVALARCFFPLPPVLELNPQLGTRHLAAMGITQQTDCVCVVVSEETGKISLAVKGELIRGLDREGLKNRLLAHKV